MTVASGHQVLDGNGAPIELEEGAVEINSAGDVRQNGETIAQLQVSRVDDKALLEKAGQNLFRFTGSITHGR